MITDQRQQMRRETDRMSGEEMRQQVKDNFLAGCMILAVLFGAAMLLVGMHIGAAGAAQKTRIVASESR